MTRWIGVAGIAGVGVFAAVVAKAAPGRTTPAVSGSVPTTPAATSPLTEVPPSGDGGLQAPAQAPRSARGPAAAVSGGS
jgi:hypothetical protein